MIYFPASIQRVMAIAVAWLLLFSNAALSQKFNEVVDNYTQKYPLEQVYLHYDKTIYTAGETIWFKAYLRDGYEATTLSKNLYVDFSDESGKVLAHSMFPVGESSSRGQFMIPKDFSGTVLQVKAYTKWMLNFDTAFLYKKTIRVIPKGNQNIFIRPQKTKISFTLFPEGGQLISGIESKVAFLATDQYGKPAAVSGTVKDSKGSKVADINTQHNGMGYFTLKPTAGERYQAQWSGNEGNEGQAALPMALTNGVTLSATPKDSSIAYKIQRTSGVTEAMKRVIIVGMMYNRLVYMANINLAEKTQVEGSIPFLQLPAGILQLTVLDENKKPLAERIVFVKTEDYRFNAEVGLSKLGTGKRQENEVSVHIPDKLLTNISLSVTDAGINYDNSENIYSGLLLTTQIKGRVYNPAYYFSENNKKVNNELDLVMLTHGWRKYNWDYISKGAGPEIKYQPDTAYMSFGGKIYATQEQIASGGDLIAILKMKGDVSTSGQNFIVVPIRKDGTFNDNSIAFMDSVSVYYTFSNKNSPLRYAEVRFLEGKLVPPAKIPLDAADILATKSIDSSGFWRDRYFATMNFTNWEEGDLKDVVVEAKTKTALEKLDERYASGFFKGDAYQFDLTNDVSAMSAQNIFQYLQSRVPGLQINNVQASSPSLSWRGATPTLFLDEMQVDPEFVANLNVNDIAYVKVFRPPFFGAPGGGSGGGIAVYTKKGGDVTSGSSGPAIPSKVIEAYTLVKEFYHPDYAVLNPEHEKQDLRSTLYWNPMILLDEKTQTHKFKFYNNDVAGAFRIVMEGINADGKLIHIEKVIK